MIEIFNYSIPMELVPSFAAPHIFPVYRTCNLIEKIKYKSKIACVKATVPLPDLNINY
jgi:hypothetical protein